MDLKTNISLFIFIKRKFSLKKVGMMKYQFGVFQIKFQIFIEGIHKLSE